MSLLFETICVRNGKPERLDLHSNRMNASRREVFGCSDRIELDRVLAGSAIPPGELLRCRVVYEKAVVSVEYTPYHIRPIQTLRIVHADDIVYDHKYVDRSRLEQLVSGCGADDIIIVRNGMVTDASFANLVFVGKDGWATPSTPLLRGTRRAHLIAEGKLHEVPIGENEIRRYSHVMLINAMRGPDRSGAIPVTAIDGLAPES
jgi:4-amino-4-deoxychorismate lyase